MRGAALLAAANTLSAARRTFTRGSFLERGAILLTLGATLGIALLAGLATAAAIETTRSVLAQLPAIAPENLVERLLAAAFGGAFALLLLGALTTAVSTLFLSEELAALAALPIPASTLFARQMVVTAAAASAPTFLVAVPAILAAARRAPRPALAAGALLLLIAALAAAASLLGGALAIALVRLVPPRRARFAAAFLAAVGLSAALVGFRAARPERLLDPIAALELLEAIGTTPVGDPSGPFAWCARWGTDALLGEAGGLTGAAGAAAAALTLAFVSVALLSRAHRAAWETARESPVLVRKRARGRVARSLASELWRAELRTLLRDASTPAQLGTLSAVAALYLLNVRLLPTCDAASRDLLLGLQTALALFLVGALALRFGYPAVSSDGRAALVLQSLPISPARHLRVRCAVRAIPALVLGLLLVGASGIALGAPPGAFARALLLAAAGSLAIPALHVGLGALRPRYDAENPIAVALGPGGLLAIALATALSLLAAPVASRELALLVATLLRVPAPATALLLAWLALAALLGLAPLLSAARVLSSREIPAS